MLKSKLALLATTLLFAAAAAPASAEQLPASVALSLGQAIAEVAHPLAAVAESTAKLLVAEAHEGLSSSGTSSDPSSGDGGSGDDDSSSGEGDGGNSSGNS